MKDLKFWCYTLVASSNKHAVPLSNYVTFLVWEPQVQ